MLILGNSPTLFRKFANMFDDEEEDEYMGGEVKEDLSSFNAMYKSNEYKYFDSDRIEAIIDHLFMTNQFRKAKWAAENAYEHFPYNKLFLVRKAQALSLIGELKEGIKLLLQLEKTEGKSLDILLSLASSFSQLRDSESAIKYYKKCLELAEEDDKGELYVDLAIEYENNNDYKSAIDILNQAILSDPVNESLVFEMAYCYDQMQEYDKAIKCFVDYIDEQPYSFTAWYNLANAYAKIRDFDNAIWAYEYCILINEDFAPAYFNLGNTFVEQNEFIKALEFYKKCIEIDGEDAMVFCSMGECLEELGHLEEAYEFYRKSTDLIPQLADAWIGRGIVNDLLGNTAQAKSEIKNAIRLEPTNYTYQHSLANVFENNNEIEEALTWYRKALEMNRLDGDLLLDYFKCLASKDPVMAIYEGTSDETVWNIAETKLVMVYAFWKVNRRTDAELTFEELLIRDNNVASQLFMHFPTLKNYPFFAERLENLD